jgi:hypothetical protein
LKRNPDLFTLDIQEEIRKHQLQLQSLKQDVADSMTSQLAHLINRVSPKVPLYNNKKNVALFRLPTHVLKVESPFPVVNVTATAAFLDPSLVTPRTPRRGDGDLFTFAASPAMTPNTFGKAMSARW